MSKEDSRPPFVGELNAGNIPIVCQLHDCSLSCWSCSGCAGCHDHSRYSEFFRDLLQTKAPQAAISTGTQCILLLKSCK